MPKTAPGPYHKPLVQSQTALDFEPPQQARRTGENNELPREFERFLQTGQTEEEPDLAMQFSRFFAILASAKPPAASRHHHYLSL